ncbi:hypothetical protein [Actinophytocola oryzae]|uniref:Uncharacterized protein YukE n=1 Tax=Actinophytocola oryzae TaxID=502181 RepID=A0A4R7VXX1_9PSEU|nr:hypothetical protein [Actinophytocola oryzae]TDV55000.1 uncharacterized protein YukE [Actinophytocola oryzae]
MTSGISAGTVTMNYGAVTGASQKLTQYSGEINNALQSLDTALGPVRETWYRSGSQSGVEAQAAESSLRTSLVGMADIINRIGALLGNSAVEAADLDRSLGNNFRNQGSAAPTAYA